MGTITSDGLAKPMKPTTTKKVIQGGQLMMEESNEVRDYSVTQWRPFIDCQTVISIVLMTFVEMVPESFRSSSSVSGSEYC